MHDVYQVTGNEYLSLPTIRERDGAVEGITFLYMQAKGMIELRGQQGLMAPYVELHGKKISTEPTWSRRHCWIPTMTQRAQDVCFSCTYLTPMGERGLCLHLEAQNCAAQAQKITLGVSGDWAETLHEINETTTIDQGREVKRSGWNHMFVFSQKPGLPLFALAPILSDDQPFSHFDQGAEWSQTGFDYDMHKTALVAPDKTVALDVFFGVGYEEVAAATSAKELLRQGWNALLQHACAWLAAREKHLEDPRLHELLNTNLFFAFFFASGRTIDTEELCLMTSRSPRYYVSAAYWDRDSLLWAFPAILATDAEYARELLLAVFTRQSRNFGIHSRYIDGTVLEPGFELDELCAPVIALDRYIHATGDKDILLDGAVQRGIAGILRKLEQHRHSELPLYDTFLQPTDDLRRYPYLTYDNALVAYILKALGALLNRPALMQQAEDVRQAIYAHLTVEQNGSRVFAWSSDLNGHSDIYDEPPGSLLLLPFYGFCAESDAVWQNTLRLIQNEHYEFSFAGHPIAEIGCKHAPHPWVLSICNSLLSGGKDKALRHLTLTSLDNGIACESVHEDTGECMTGAAFATCAGFLAYSLLCAHRGE